MSHLNSQKLIQTSKKQTPKKQEVKKGIDGDLICGIEIEMEYNPNLMGLIYLSPYHSSCISPFGKYFIAEQDGSLKCKKFKGKVEIISKPFRINDFDTILNDFENTIYNMVAKNLSIKVNEAREKYKMKDLINFNKSMGAHIHFSFLKKPTNVNEKEKIFFRNELISLNGKFLPIRDIVTLKILKLITNNLKERLQKVLPKVSYKLWEQHLFRHYSEEIKTLLDAYQRRESEFNLTQNNLRIEYRSFNLYKISTWERFFEAYSDVFEILQKVFKDEFRKEFPFENNEKLEFEINNNPTFKKEIKKELKIKDIFTKSINKEIKIIAEGKSNHLFQIDNEVN